MKLHPAMIFVSLFFVGITSAAPAESTEGISCSERKKWAQNEPVEKFDGESPESLPCPVLEYMAGRIEENKPNAIEELDEATFNEMPCGAVKFFAKKYILNPIVEAREDVQTSPVPDNDEDGDDARNGDDNPPSDNDDGGNDEDVQTSPAPDNANDGDDATTGDGGNDKTGRIYKIIKKKAKKYMGKKVAKKIVKNIKGIEAAKDKGKDLIEAASDKVKDVIEAVKDKGKDLKEGKKNVKEIFKNLLVAANEKGKDLIEAAKDKGKDLKKNSKKIFKKVFG